MGGRWTLWEDGKGLNGECTQGAVTAGRAKDTPVERGRTYHEKCSVTCHTYTMEETVRTCFLRIEGCRTAQVISEPVTGREYMELHTVTYCACIELQRTSQFDTH